MISEVFNGTYKIGTAPWNALSKEEYLEILQKMKSSGDAAILNAGKISAVKDCVNTELGIRVTVFYDHMRHGEYSGNDFQNEFSSYTSYKSLILTVCNQFFSWSYRITPSSSGRGFSMSTNVLTLAQLETLSETATKYVESLFSQYAAVVPSDEPEKLDGAAKEAEITEGSRSSSAAQEKNQKKPRKTHFRKSHSDRGNNMYKWVDLMRALFDFIRTVFFLLF